MTKENSPNTPRQDFLPFVSPYLMSPYLMRLYANLPDVNTPVLQPVSENIDDPKLEAAKDILKNYRINVDTLLLTLNSFAIGDTRLSLVDIWITNKQNRSLSLSLDDMYRILQPIPNAGLVKELSLFECTIFNGQLKLTEEDMASLLKTAFNSDGYESVVKLSIFPIITTWLEKGNKISENILNAIPENLIPQLYQTLQSRELYSDSETCAQFYNRNHTMPEVQNFSARVVTQENYAAVGTTNNFASLANANERHSV